MAAQWHPTLNGDLTPADVAVQSGRKVWWVCDRDHAFQSTVSNRTAGWRCGYCAGKLPIPGVTDLASQRPDIARYWHPTLNGDLTPADVTVGSSRTVWWLCENGHEMDALVKIRTKGHGCFACTKHGYSPGESAQVYLIRSRSLKARKIGVQNVGSARIEQHGPEWELLALIDAPGLAAFRTEQAVLRWLRRDCGLAQYLDRDEMRAGTGHTETFALDEGPSDYEVIERVKLERARQMRTDGLLARDF